MIPVLFPIYGPFSINSYGVCIAIAIIVFTLLVLKYPVTLKLISEENFIKLVIYSTFAGIVGGRLLYLLLEAENIYLSSFYKIWHGGMSLLGGVIGVLFFAIFYLKRLKIPVLRMMDVIGIYASLLQAISRIGCFCAGCCYGIPTSCALGVRYTHPDSFVPFIYKNIKIHPTQLYSSLSLFIIFLLMRFVFSKILKKPGQLISLYIVLSSLERFLTDFWRGDRIFLPDFGFIFSVHQIIALALLIISLVFFTIN
jgi:phosphatidylglycerol:prolipoprotein diacylglycerol transferase